MFSDVVAFWIFAIIAILILREFPRSPVTRALFSPLGPRPPRYRRRYRYQMQWASFAALWLAQSISLYAAGWLLRLWLPDLGDSLAFLVFWAVLIPTIAVIALAVATVASVGALRGWIVEADRRVNRRTRRMMVQDTRQSTKGIDPIAVDARDRG